MSAEEEDDGVVAEYDVGGGTDEPYRGAPALRRRARYAVTTPTLICPWPPTLRATASRRD